MFLAFGKNTIIGTNEMLPKCIERILKINDAFDTSSTIPASMLTVTPSNTAKKNMVGSSKDGCRTYPKELIVSSNDKDSSCNCLHKDPQSYQPVKTNHVENGQEG